MPQTMVNLILCVIPFCFHKKMGYGCYKVQSTVLLPNSLTLVKRYGRGSACELTGQFCVFSQIVFSQLTAASFPINVGSLHPCLVQPTS